MTSYHYADVGYAVGSGPPSAETVKAYEQQKAKAGLPVSAVEQHALGLPDLPPPGTGLPNIGAYLGDAFRGLGEGIGSAVQGTGKGVGTVLQGGGDALGNVFQGLSTPLLIGGAVVLFILINK